MSAEKLSQQLLWYEEQLVQLDSDQSASLIIVACHHPPYTNSKILHPLLTRDKQKWQDLFPEKTDQRFFHNIICEIQKKGILVSVKRPKADHSGIETPYTFLVSKEEI